MVPPNLAISILGSGKSMKIPFLELVQDVKISINAPGWLQPTTRPRPWAGAEVSDPLPRAIYFEAPGRLEQCGSNMVEVSGSMGCGSGQIRSDLPLRFICRYFNSIQFKIIQKISMSESQTDILLDYLPQLVFAPNHPGLNRVESPRAQRLVLKLLKKQAPETELSAAAVLMFGFRNWDTNGPTI